ncbi:alpha/beta hydrolase [Alteromonadaceae bacterium BrNp21-10]|nr:alpha/beta hydrolase [Alteromonadaceae bacterium BrNp21-10]
MNRKSIRLGKWLTLIGMSVFLSSCTYLKYSSIQAEYNKIQRADPSQVNVKHMINRDTFFAFGKSIDTAKRYVNHTLAIAAYSNKFKQHERVDTMFFKGTGKHYGLTLPEGEYTFLLYADVNNDLVLQQSEVVANKKVVIDTQHYPEKIAKNIDIELGSPFLVSWAENVSVPPLVERSASLYYPQGTIRSLDDPIFDEAIATMGMYDPASFLEYAPTMFYALEEDIAYKIPVIFVHGIGGSTRSFQSIIAQLDPEKFKPWFFYYPSGGDLDQLADFFYNLFLSGDLIPIDQNMSMIVVAHSMGGLVVREAINKYKNNNSENKISLFFSIATPFGGHPSAESGEKHGLIVLPAWKDLNPNNEFIHNLYRKPLPDFVNHQLYYGFKNDNTIKLAENSDGVVPLSSQLYPMAQQQSSGQFGFNNGHVDILNNEEMISQMATMMNNQKSHFPDSHLAILAEGGFDVELNDSYSPITRHIIGYAGKYLVSLVNGVIEPFNSEQEAFIKELRGNKVPSNLFTREFIRFMTENPELVNPN